MAALLEALPAVSNLRRSVEKQRPRPPRIIIKCGMNHDEAHDHHLRLTRRLAIGITLLANAGAASAQDNGLWIDGPLPVPHATNSKELLLSSSILN